MKMDHGKKLDMLVRKDEDAYLNVIGGQAGWLKDGLMNEQRDG